MISTNTFDHIDVLNRALRYDQITLVPNIVSTVRSRSEIDPAVNFGEIHLKVPIIAAPMPDVCNGEMASALANSGALGIIHRFQPIERQVEEYISSCDINPQGTYHRAGCAIGATGDYKDRLEELVKEGCKVFCIDTANGFNTVVAEAIRWIRLKYEGVFIIAGNVATPEGYEFLASQGVDAVRVGIAGGSVCTTKTETGVYVPMATCIAKCAAKKDELISTIPNPPLIIADGGIKEPADMCKAIALGADVIMAGGIFAGTEETPAELKEIDGQRYKDYRGAASFSVKRDWGGKTSNVEGREILVPYRGPVHRVVERFYDGLVSSMSYFDSRTITEYRRKVTLSYELA